MDLNSIYKDKKVLVTGHTGFKGGWLSIWLQMLGADVYGYSLDPLYNEGIFVASGIKKHMHDARGDIRDLDKVKGIFTDIQPDIVFHLAAQPIVLESYAQPVETFETNTLGTAHVLEAIRGCGSVRAAVMITTDKCYENREWIWSYREDDPMGGHDPYSASKGAAELVISSYRRSFFNEPGLPAIASARAGNVIGGGDWSSYRLVPDIFRSLASGKLLELRNPMATRPWQHVLEPLGGYLLLAARLMEHPREFEGAWNFGPYPHEVRPVKDVVDKIIETAGKGKWKDVSGAQQLHESMLLTLDISKAMQQLHWAPVLDFDEMIQLTTEWYMKYRHEDVLELSRAQIQHYTDLWKSRKER